MNKKLMIAGITFGFLLVSGICYSCSYQKEQLELNNKDAIDLVVTETAIDEQEGLILSENEIIEDNPRSPAAAPDGQDEAGVIYVHVCGAVHQPGVYEMKESARVVDALELAGGLTSDAAGDYLNQAQSIADGQRIYVPTQSELDHITIDELVTGQQAAQERKQDTSLVNINTADAAQLMTLPGIGQSKANSIIEYRNANGVYQVKEDLMKVPGIKEGSFAQIADKISVN